VSQAPTSISFQTRLPDSFVLVIVVVVAVVVVGYHSCRGVCLMSWLSKNVESFDVDMLLRDLAHALFYFILFILLLLFFKKRFNLI
jgi:succinate dehydrogenase/fumarate reductase cytochrome b subunit